MKSFPCQPYKLYNSIKNYEWGTKNGQAFIPKFLGTQPEPNVPYAELWIGAHPNASSEIEIAGERIPMHRVVEQFPDETLGSYVREKFNGTFPFLLKVLSAEHALSIQTHPNKTQAQRLHQQDPQNYPDDNHKPEIAIAIDSLDALVGFQPLASIRNNLKTLPELTEFIGNKLIDPFLSDQHRTDEAMLAQKIYETMMHRADEKERLSICIEGIRQRLEQKGQRSPEEEQFLEQYKLFGADVGLLSFFFFNLIHLKTGEAIFTDAGIPHAYIKGNICECMANSDNVVRAGLTNKFKDVPALLDILRYDFAECPVMKSQPDASETIYPTSAQEFEVRLYKKTSGCFEEQLSNQRPSVLLLTKGSLKLQWSSDGTSNASKYSAGESIFLPASLPKFRILAQTDVEYFSVVVP
ncbi:MAG TPA: mannose-6-phosphate isomerase, class I [Bacteroidota bacterium]|nr:mannose-6-phosphate isomerase, class I [Bacteroidota bacterium]